jgi:O-antigen/teichoic acid export membrane protein
LVTLVLGTFLPSVFRLVGHDAILFCRAVYFLGAAFAVGLPAKIIGAYLCGLQRFDLFNLGSSSFALIQAILLFVVLVRGYGIVGCAAVTLVTALLSLCLQLYLVRRADPLLMVRLGLFNWRDLQDLFGFGFHVSVYQIGDLMRYRLDSFVIARWLTLPLVTHFNVASRLAEYFRNVTAGVAGPLVTEMSTLEGQAGQAKMRVLLIHATRLTALLCLFVCALLCLNGRTLLTLWVGKTFVSSYILLVVLIASQTVAMIQSPSMGLLLARGRHRALATWTVCEGLANFGLSVYWASKYGILGVAMGTAVPMLFSKLILQPWYTMHVAGVGLAEYVIGSLTRPLLVFGAFLAIVHIETPFADASPLISLLSAIIWQSAIYVLLAYTIGFSTSDRQVVRRNARKFVTALSPQPAR